MAQLRSRNRAQVTRTEEVLFGMVFLPESKISGLVCEDSKCKFLTLELATLKDYKRELSEKQMPNTAVIIFIYLYLMFLPRGTHFLKGGGVGGDGRGGGKRTSHDFLVREILD